MRDHIPFEPQTGQTKQDYRATLQVSEFQFTFVGERESGNYITATAFYSYNNDADRFEKEYLRGAFALIRAVPIHMPGWRVLLFITKAAYLRSKDDLDRTFESNRNACLCIVSEQSFESSAETAKLRNLTKRGDLSMVQQVVASSGKWYLPTTYRYLPFLQPNSFTFVQSFAAVDLDVCFTEIYAYILKEWHSTTKSLFYVQWTELTRHFHTEIPYRRDWHLNKTGEPPQHQYLIVPLGGGVAFRETFSDKNLQKVRDAVWAQMNTRPEHGIDERVLQIIFNSNHFVNKIHSYTTCTTVHDSMDAEDILKSSGLQIRVRKGPREHPCPRNIVLNLIMDTLYQKLSVQTSETTGMFEFHDGTNEHDIWFIPNEPNNPNDRFGIYQLLFCPVFELVIKQLRVPAPGFLEDEAKNYIDTLLEQHTDSNTYKAFRKKMAGRTEFHRRRTIRSLIGDMNYFVKGRRRKLSLGDIKIMVGQEIDEFELQKIDNFEFAQMTFLKRANDYESSFSLPNIHASLPIKYDNPSWEDWQDQSKRSPSFRS